jgi:hypothetical protein
MIGDKAHRKQHLESLMSDCYQNIWTLGVKRLIQEEDMADRERNLASAKQLLEQKGFASANEGKQAITTIEQGIESLKAGIQATDEAVGIENTKIENIKRYMKKTD